MSWAPGPRPDWVRAYEGDGPLAEQARRPLTRDALLAEARALAGVDDGGLADFGGDDLVEPLDVLLPALEQEAELTGLGRWLTHRFLLRLLRVRLQVTAYLRADPGVRDETVEAPIVVTGAPRTGTTILHALLADDPALRAPLGWELLLPVPPPAPGAAEDARVMLAEEELRALAEVAPRMDTIHEYGARRPKECLSAMSFGLRSEEFTARYHVPSYAAWLAGTDPQPAYDWHRLTLQLLQRRSGRTRWVLKSPVHLHALPTVLATYPDARLLVTHRDPLTVLGSVTSLIATLRWVHSDRVELAEVAAENAALYHAALDGLVTLTERGGLPADRVHHGHYAEFVDDPLAAVKAAYDGIGEPLTAEAEDRMRARLAASPQGRHGRHDYGLDGIGLDVGALRASFARYTDAFAVPVEARS